MTKFLIRKGRRDDAAALGQVTVAGTRAALGGRVPACWLEGLSADDSARAWAARFVDAHTLRDGQRLFVAVAEKGSTPLGLALLGETVPETLARPALAEIFSHELLALHVDPLWEEHGVSRQLLLTAMGRAMRAGGTGMLVRALAGDRHRALYGTLSAERISAQPYARGGHKTRVLIYGWHWPDEFRGPHPGSAEASGMVDGSST